MKKKIKLRNLLLLAVGIILVGAGAYYNYISSQVKLVPYEVTRGDLKEVVESTGTVASQSSTVIYAKQGGFVSDLAFEVGNVVNAGDTVAVLSAEDLYYSIQTAQAQVNGARAEYARAAEQNDPLLTAMSQTAVDSAQLNYDTAVKTLADTQALFDAGAVSQAELDGATLAVSHAEAALTTAKNQLALQKKGTSRNLLSSISAGITAAQSELNRLKAMDGNRTVVAAQSGVMTERYVDLGTYVAPGMPLAEISAVDQLLIETDVVAKDVPSLSVGMKADLYADGSFITTGTLSKIHPKLTEIMSNLGIVQKRVRVEITVDGVSAAGGSPVGDSPVGDRDISDGAAPATLMLGQDVDVEFIQNEKKDVILVETDYVYEDGPDGSNYVLVIEDGKLAMRPVEVGLQGELYYEIVSGLAAGDQIVGEIENTVAVGDRVSW
ncbi:efflux RND transporter periplasmic adaptor subunit [Acidaminobacter hydrogenoformans]|uniref:Multidrug resistance efflux pump n=1 Tax=Acidaminobacter hydrogenoformans DSM 2784 TaxID=1120920 RepID=A0A1G5S4Q1_9FIRM|nr:HlyD family efflux transporter periplasmic adaptor subunit [Acidaminobacter hydrogenoformans]SCZ81344.1 Multidrug resistance efflux pump [Acidaminobacter hydrogenoformans DSM 2784]